MKKRSYTTLVHLAPVKMKIQLRHQQKQSAAKPVTATIMADESNNEGNVTVMLQGGISTKKIKMMKQMVPHVRKVDIAEMM